VSRSWRGETIDGALLIDFFCMSRPRPPDVREVRSGDPADVLAAHLADLPGYDARPLQAHLPTRH
jgi:hypothetical protein